MSAHGNYVFDQYFSRHYISGAARYAKAEDLKVGVLQLRNDINRGAMRGMAKVAALSFCFFLP
jgi:hypothetical protein